MFVGDAAYQVNPLTGGGITASMRAGICAGNTAVAAIAADNYSIDGLWAYNRCYAQEQGAQFAATALTWDFLLALSAEEFNVAVQYLLRSRDVEYILQKGMSHPLIDYSLADLLRGLRGMGYLTLLTRLITLHFTIRRMYHLYAAYPDRPQFHRWKRAIERYRKRFK